MTLPAGIVSISMIPVIKNDSVTSQHRILLTKRDEEIFPGFEKRQTAEACGAQMTSLKPGDSGMILSPNYPDLYPPSVKCAWWLQVIVLQSFLINDVTQKRQKSEHPKKGHSNTGSI
jgi:hypothetical protein